MDSLVVYDSIYGNTEQIARAICQALGSGARLAHAGTVKPSEVDDFDVLVIGSPTHGGRPTPAVEEFLTKLPANRLKGKGAAAFDTRFAPEEQGLGLRILMAVIRFAAERIANTLRRKGAALLMPPEGFIVEDKKGPLKEGELDRAVAWTKALTGKVDSAVGSVRNA